MSEHNSNSHRAVRAASRWSRVNVVDLFAAFNCILFVLLGSTMYWQRFLQFKSRANFPEFLAYATALLLGICVAWALLRRLRINPAVLCLFEVGLLLHFAAGLLHPGGLRLYDVQIGLSFFDYPLRFDKVVHLCNAFVGCAITLEIFRLLNVRTQRAQMLVVCLTVLGCGASVEMLEYLVLKTIPHNGVGDYDNNMTDLIGNFFGCSAFVAVRWVLGALGVRNAIVGLHEPTPQELSPVGDDPAIPHLDTAIASSSELLAVSGKQQRGAA
jgi:hypothetical protein